MNLFFLSSENLKEFIKRLSARAALFYPFIENGKAHIIEYNSEQIYQPNFKGIRTTENVKHFFFPSRDIVARFPADLNLRTKPQILLGIKNCDLRGIEIYDRVFMHWEPVDPIYKGRRENTIIISADCPEPEPSCFCNLVGLKPFAEAVADLNLTEIKVGYFFEIFTKKGAELIKSNSDLFQEASKKDIEERHKIRQRAMEKLEKINNKTLPFEIANKIEKANKQFMRTSRNECVECFGCLHCCPTCYCFLLNDYKKGDAIARVRVWDACYYSAYARVGGGANPRSRIDERFWNRFQCKFNYFYQYEKFFACSGCGRCFVGCSAKIDIREILNKL